MPELPEVETTRRGIEPHLVGRRVRRVIVRQRQLRWPVTRGLEKRLPGATIGAVGRRAKYLLIATDQGSVVIHLGMSGSLRMVKTRSRPETHDHVDIVLSGGSVLRFRDPRRFGSVLFTAGDPLRLPLLRELGPEPLSAEFDGAYLASRSRGRQVAIKNLVMNSHIVVGVGNIYASEALFRAGIHPGRAAGRVSAVRLDRLVAEIRMVLSAAIRKGGTTLRDFTNEEGLPGYFQLELDVYGRQDEPCTRCEAPIRHSVIGQRSTYHCPRCQR